MPSFELERRIAAPVHTVWDVLTDHRAYARWAGVDESVLEREGSPDPNGVGAVRRVRKAIATIREEIVASEMPKSFSYTLTSGAPVRDYLAVVTLTESGDSTLVRWTVRFEPKVPLTGFAMVPVIRKIVGDLLKAATRESERRAKQ
jgi:uncharacterized protein YndB with AHSA1/START domain